MRYEMSAYRTPDAAPSQPRFVVRFGSRRRRIYLPLGLLLFALGFVSFSVAITNGAPCAVVSPVVLVVPIVAAFFVLGAARCGEVELLPERRVLVLVRRYIVARRIEIPFDDVETVRLGVNASTYKDESGVVREAASYAINLELRDRTICLASSGDANDLKADHEALVALLSGHDVLWSVTRRRE